MAASTELREPFLDHRLFELALKQPPERKRDGDTGKRLLRKIAQRILPEQLRLAPKRPLQTPQREWLRDPLRDWASGWIDAALSSYGGVWLDADQVNKQWLEYQQGESDNSFFVWQWISLGLCSQLAGSRSYVGNDQ
jgi:asparagine synthase (glutamine-hydrolysing)